MSANLKGKKKLKKLPAGINFEKQQSIETQKGIFEIVTYRIKLVCESSLCVLFHTLHDNDNGLQDCTLQHCFIYHSSRFRICIVWELTMIFRPCFHHRMSWEQSILSKLFLIRANMDKLSQLQKESKVLSQNNEFYYNFFCFLCK